MFGIKLNNEQSKIVEKNWSNEKYNLIKYIEGRPECNGWVLVFDGMSCENHFFGKVFTRSEEYDEKPYYELDNDDISGYLDKECGSDIFLDQFNDCFEGFVPEVDSDEEWKLEPKLLLVNHFS